MGRGCAISWTRQAPLERLPKRAQQAVPIVIDDGMGQFQRMPQLRDGALPLCSSAGGIVASTTDSSRAVVRARR